MISAGTSVRESVTLIRAQGAQPVAVLIALDRQERGGDAVRISPLSATQEVARDYGIPVLAIACLDDLLRHLDASDQDSDRTAHRTRIADYRNRFGTDPTG